MAESSQNVREQLAALLPRLRRFGRTLARHREDADDLVQIALERALTRTDQWLDVPEPVLAKHLTALLADLLFCFVPRAGPPTSSISRSPPMPVIRRAIGYAMSMSCLESTSTHAWAWASLLSTSVPSTSRRTPA